MIDYKKLTDMGPTSYGTITNRLGQRIEFVEHPLKGDEYPVICVCHELKLAETSEFWEIDDMVSEHAEYQPYFENNQLKYGLML